MINKILFYSFFLNKIYVRHFTVDIRTNYVSVVFKCPLPFSMILYYGASNSTKCTYRKKPLPVLKGRGAMFELYK